MAADDPGRGRRASAAILTALVAVVLVVGATPIAAASVRYAGRPLADVLAELSAGGLRLVYSSAVVEPGMVVATEPRSREPRALLAELLAPFGLEAQEGPSGTLLVVAIRRAGPRLGTIAGQVEAPGAEALLEGVVVRVEGGPGTVCDGGGGFVLQRVPTGRQVVVAESPAFLPARLEGVEVKPGKTTPVRLQLAPAVAFIDQIVVTPSHFRILEARPESRQFLGRDEVERMPHVADDLFRAVRRLPGAAGGDFSAQLNVRGGDQDELLVLLDGHELYEPFHFKDFHNLFSTIDSGAVGGLDLMTGGFPVEYGDRMSGVMDISVATPSGPTTSAASLSTLYGRFLSGGLFDEGRGAWLVGGRGWYPDLVLELAGATADELLTDYYDLLAKVEHDLGSRSKLSVDLLAAYDALGYETEDDTEHEQVGAHYRSYDLWLNLTTGWSDRLGSRTIVSAGRFRRHRRGGVVDAEEGTLDVDDHRELSVVGLKQDWTLALSGRHLLKWGVDLRSQEASYDYLRQALVTDPEVIGDGPPVASETRVALEPGGESFAAYVGDRVRLAPPLVVELGLRWDHQSWLDQSELSPRLNLMLELGERTTVRAAWGRFYQSQRVNEIEVGDGVTELYPAQLAEQWLASVERRFAGGTELRVELYRKRVRSPRPRHENLLNPFDLFPEAGWDRVRIDPERGRADGVELLLKRADAAGGRVDWWASYTLARAEDEIDGRWAPRSWDQRHAATFSFSLAFEHGWDLSLAGTFHSGWPTTEVGVELVTDEEGESVSRLVLGPSNRARFPSYQRLDLRLSRRLVLGGGGELRLFGEVINLLDRENVCCIDDVELTGGDGAAPRVLRAERYWAPLVPTIGASWRF